MDGAKDKQSTSGEGIRITELSPPSTLDSWERLRGICKDIFAELGGGEAYLRNERENFYSPERAREIGESMPSQVMKEDA